jgi:hypothetical protein
VRTDSGNLGGFRVHITSSGFFERVELRPNSIELDLRIEGLSPSAANCAAAAARSRRQLDPKKPARTRKRSMRLGDHVKMSVGQRRQAWFAISVDTIVKNLRK